MKEVFIYLMLAIADGGEVDKSLSILSNNIYFNEKQCLSEIEQVIPLYDDSFRKASPDIKNVTWQCIKIGFNPSDYYYPIITK